MGRKEGLEPSADAKKIVELIYPARTVGPEEQAKISQKLFKLRVDSRHKIVTVGLTPKVRGHRGEEYFNACDLYLGERMTIAHTR